MGVSGERGGSLDVEIERPDVRPWRGAGGDGNLQVWRGINRRYGCMAMMRLDAGSAPLPGDATGVRSDPLAKMVAYYATHLAITSLGTPHA